VNKTPSVVEIISAGLDAMVDTADAHMDAVEAQAIVSVAYALVHLLFGEDASEEQLKACLAASRAAYMAGRERRVMFAGYG
jgi:hypothetical protein